MRRFIVFLLTVCLCLAACARAEESDTFDWTLRVSAAGGVSAADIAVKAADVDLIEVRLSRGMGGKCFVLMTGEVADVRSAVSAACEIVEKDGMLAACTVIPSPHEDLKKYLF